MKRSTEREREKSKQKGEMISKGEEVAVRTRERGQYVMKGSEGEEPK